MSKVVTPGATSVPALIRRSRGRNFDLPGNLGLHDADQVGGAPESDLSLAGDEFGRGKQQRRVLAVTDTPQVVEVGVSEQDHVDIARCIARAGEVAEQPAGRVLELVDAAACVDQHQLVAGVDEGGVDLKPHRARRLERGCEQASCVLGPIAPQRFGRERERAVADDGEGPRRASSAARHHWPEVVLALLINEEPDPKGRLSVSNWIVQKLDDYAVSLPRKFGFPATETLVRRDPVRMRDY